MDDSVSIRQVKKPHDDPRHRQYVFPFAKEAVAMQNDEELTAVVRSRQLHIYRNGKKVLVLAGKSTPKIIREDPICEMIEDYA